LASNQKVSKWEEVIFTLFLTTNIIILIASILIILSLFLATKLNLNREKASPFECGFDSNSSSRLPFSLRFFLVTIVFLIFDVEIVILLPCVKSLIFSNLIYWWGVLSIFISILLIGLFHEWNQGALNWSLWTWSNRLHLVSA